MTVSELIEILQKMPQDLEVCHENYDSKSGIRDSFWIKILEWY